MLRPSGLNVLLGPVDGRRYALVTVVEVELTKCEATFVVVLRPNTLTTNSGATFTSDARKLNGTLRMLRTQVCCSPRLADGYPPVRH
jgi:hypothetical protein